jgi:hypothetical protein
MSLALHNRELVIVSTVALQIGSFRTAEIYAVIRAALRSLSMLSLDELSWSVICATELHARLKSKPTVHLVLFTLSV